MEGRGKHGDIVNDNDSDHSFSQLSEHKTLTRPEGQSAWALAPSLFSDKKTRSGAERRLPNNPARTSCLQSC